MGAMEPEFVLVPHTHWDREWYEPFARFRERLVEMMDSLAELTSADPPFEHFHLDGQSAMIDDYLEVRPEREPDIRRMAGDGRISVGPWFTQMDEFLTSGESMIRNLEWGLARAESFGARRPLAGYLPDQFGHIGQMPQILRNAGIDRAVLWRGVPGAIDKTSFVWESPDGSSVLTEYLAFGYSIGWQVNQVSTAEELAGALRQAAEWLAPYSVEPDRVLVMVGGDHQVPAARLTPLLAELASTGGLRARIGPLAGYLEGQAIDPATLPHHVGELRSAARAHLLPNVYAARPHQKLARASVEASLERWAEPLSALVAGVEWPARELERAWRLLLWNGAHDSVCGCSVDQVARDVDQRASEAALLAAEAADRAMEALAAQMTRAGRLFVNPSPFERYGIPGLGWVVTDVDDSPVPESDDLPLEAGEDGWVSVGGFRVRLMDEPDIGDLYSFCPAEGASAVPADGIDVVDDGEGARLLHRFGHDLRVELWATREEGSAAVRLELAVLNDRPDHRLRLHVELAGRADASVALTPFEVVHRPLRSEGGTETASPTWPARGAVRAGDVALFHRGVFEYEVLEDRPELAVTLVRAVGTISRPEISTRAWAAGPDIATPEAQLLSTELPLSIGIERDVPDEELPRCWERHVLRPAGTTSPGGGHLPDRGSLLPIEGAELSAVRRVEGGVEVRLWNPRRDAVTATVAGRQVELGPARIETVRLDQPSLEA
jgi:hypothetical protein